MLSVQIGAGQPFLRVFFCPNHSANVQVANYLVYRKSAIICTTILHHYSSVIDKGIVDDVHLATVNGNLQSVRVLHPEAEHIINQTIWLTQVRLLRYIGCQYFLKFRYHSGSAGYNYRPCDHDRYQQCGAVFGHSGCSVHRPFPYNHQRPLGYCVLVLEPCGGHHAGYWMLPLAVFGTIVVGVIVILLTRGRKNATGSIDVILALTYLSCCWLLWLLLHWLTQIKLKFF